MAVEFIEIKPIGQPELMQEHHYCLRVQKIKVVYIDLWLIPTFYKSFHWNEADGVSLMVMVTTF